MESNNGINSIRNERMQIRNLEMKKIYDEKFYEVESESALSAAQMILPYVVERLGCKRIVDFGCGTGEWLETAKKCKGVEHVLGLDGSYVKDYLKIASNEFRACDLKERIELDAKYDLAISLEVAEHLPEEKAEIFIGNLVRAADIILFSASVPYQGGTSHMNEQYPSYWKRLFRERGFAMCDCLRAKFWDDRRIDMCYRQNMFIFCREEMKPEVSRKFAGNNRLTDVIHPDLWEKERTHSYIFPFELVKEKKKVIIYGAGMVGRAYVSQLLATKYAEIVLWCDRSFDEYQWMKREIEDPKKISACVYDFLVIAVKDKRIASEIAETLMDMGIEKEKIIWRAPEYGQLL